MIDARLVLKGSKVYPNVSGTYKQRIQAHTKEADTHNKAYRYIQSKQIHTKEVGPYKGSRYIRMVQVHTKKASTYK